MKRRFALIFLILTLLFGLVACVSEKDGDVTGSSSEVVVSSSEATESNSDTLPEVTTEPSAVLSNDYTIIFQMDNDTGRMIALMIRKILLEKGINALVAEDIVMRGTDLSSPEYRQKYEILIGDTNRPESSEVEKPTGENDFLVALAGNKIVIHGSSYKVLAAACDFFAEKLTVEDGKCCLQLTENPFVADAGATDEEYLVLIADQKNSRISVYDLLLDSIEPSSALKSFTFEQYNIAGMKVRTYEDKTVLLAAYGTSSAKMLDYESGSLMWSTQGTGNNPHSVELIPNGVIAVAASTGASIRFFLPDSGNPVAEVSFEDAHGVLWDPKSEVLWAIGSNVLTAYTVTRNTDNTVTVTERSDLRQTIPTGGAHDLQPVYGDTDLLWITTSSKVYQFRKSTGKFLTQYTGSSQINVSKVKGIGNYADGSVVYVYPDGNFQSWTTRTVVFYRNTGSVLSKTELFSNNIGLYKIRVFNTDYQ